MNPARVLGCCVLGLAICTANLHAQEGGGEFRAKLENLRKERVETLEKAFRIAMAQYQAGTLPFDRVVTLQRQWLKARLTLESRQDQRLAIYREALEVSQKNLKVAEALFTAGRASQLDVQIARAEMLEFQIELLQEEHKQKAQK